MPSAFSTIDADVLAAVSAWGGLAALSPRPMVRSMQRYNEIAENMKAFGMRPTIWLMPVAAISNPRFTPSTQQIALRYRAYIIQPTPADVSARDIVYQVNAALIQFSNWKRADGTALAAPSPWVYRDISGPVVVDPSQLSDDERDIEDVVGVVETVVYVTAEHADLMTVPNMTLEEAEETIVADAIGTLEAIVANESYLHTPDVAVVSYNLKSAQVERKAAWFRFPINAIADAADIVSVDLEYTIESPNPAGATGAVANTAQQPPSGAAQDLYDEVYSGAGDHTAADLLGTGAKSVTLAAEALADLLAAIQDHQQYWWQAIYIDQETTYRTTTLSPTLANTRIVVTYNHYV